MNRLMLVAVLAIVGCGRSKPVKEQLDVSVEFEEAADRIYLIKDRAANVRCVAITSSIRNYGYAVSCVNVKEERQDAR